jgi:hypothetical protein
MATTTRGIVYPTVGTTLTPLANHFASLATSTDTAIGALETKGGAYRGLLSARPTAGVEGRTWYATDTNKTYFDNGTTWVIPDALVQVGSATALINGTVTLSWSDTSPNVGINPDAMWASGTPTRVTAPYAGIYRFQFSIRSSGTAPITVTPKKNGSTTNMGYYAGSSVGTAGAASNPVGGGLIQLAANDYLELDASSNTAAGASGHILRLELVRLT